ncbi:GNAT family N-acetyltransferase [Pseudonocardia asaccharolytica]|uniref:N-acetyltransferase n=1 Tax=Pseudonocardia asaccharolytica DSM 44247 = NBRC 16224 TaxID=1123024 RepID=A0A511D6D4_9PSEU|nr:GNAT family N-acetyltransferase [Pseudonocardia asaccharolytica]GEL20350.1 N-acetyltransferase [Pseudonocardia asaccharolytica DSM 44247 = NBRC 16224]
MAIAAVRPAVAQDVDEIVRIQAAVWRTAYAELVPAEALDQLAGPAARQAWAAALDAGPGYHVLVASEGAWTVGFCAAACYIGEGGVLAEVNTLLVEPRWGRRGHGGRLLAAAAGHLREDGAQRGHAWVPEADLVSRRFYARAGWEPDGAVRTLDTGDGPLREVRLAGTMELRLEGFAEPPAPTDS